MANYGFQVRSSVFVIRVRGPGFRGPQHVGPGLANDRVLKIL
jgi:hypothetical protein